MAQTSSSVFDASLSLQAMTSLVTIKLTSTNYLVWHGQVYPLLYTQKILPYVDGSLPAPSRTLSSSDDAAAVNPTYVDWLSKDQIVRVFLSSTLTEEAMAVIIGCRSSADVWSTLATTFNQQSKARELRLKDELQFIKKGSKSVSEYGNIFRGLCDQLLSLGCVIDNTDKSHWFLRGLGSEFHNFSTSQINLIPLPTFPELLAKAESHELFTRSLENPSPVSNPSQAFSAQNQSNNSGGRKYSNNRNFGNHFAGYNNKSGGRGNYNQPNGGGGKKRSPPTCQICRQSGHYATFCPDRYGNNASQTNLAEAFQAGCSLNSSSNSDWYVDTGATAHMVRSPTSLDSSSSYSGTDSVVVGNGNSLSISRIGSRNLSRDLSLLDVLVVPHITKNLLSVSKLTNDFPVNITFTDKLFEIQHRLTGVPLARGKRENGLYVLENGHEGLVAALTSTNIKGSFDLWHRRLGHASFDTIKLLNKLGFLSVSSILPNPTPCSSCHLAKSKRLSFVSNTRRASHVLDIIHCDLWGPSPITSWDGYRYYAVFIDDFSKYSWLYPLRLKSDFFDAFVKFKLLVENQLSCSIKRFQSDGGTEFTSTRFQDLLRHNGILHTMSCPYTPAQNGRAERKHRHITETGLSMLFHASVPLKFWVEAFCTAVYTINRLPSSVLDSKSPYEVLFLSAPSYENFHPFGCRVFPCLRDVAVHKFSPRSIPCIFMGYSLRHKGFNCLDPSTSRFYIRRHAQFNEDLFPFDASSLPSSSRHLQLSTFSDAFAAPSATILNTPSPKPHLSTVPPTVIIEDDQVNIISPFTVPSSSTNATVADPPLPPLPPAQPSSGLPPVAPAQPLNAPSARMHPMRTRAQDGIVRSKYPVSSDFLTYSALLSSVHSSNTPKGFKSAAKSPEWVHAMNDELNALRVNRTWELVPRHLADNVIGSKWVFRTKFLADGSIERHKARLVAQGFAQLPGFDYDHTFSPVVKASTIRIILSIAVLNNWSLHQLDVNNAFLHGRLDKPVFMEQPPGFIDPIHPSYVCRLNKAIYGLKQAPRAWFKRFSDFILSLGFVN
ncbi:hypothetical protein CASFOL_005284 [Castilleja foliolosa]|uniref:Integrase catalytic domain-containing protein n=1 Tax=Castilleja foliolosa TaxID=1961234 RepID=A0ABD3E733_9LAMI